MRKHRHICSNPFGLHSNTGMVSEGNMVKADVVHHIIPVEINTELATNLKNLIPLCEDCHELAHKLLATAKGRAEYRKIFNITTDTRLTPFDNTPTECYYTDNKKVYCVRCGKERDFPCAVCKDVKV